MPKKINRKQYTCSCNAYEFPHRFGGGKCTGIWIVEQTFGMQCCRDCNCFSSHGCDVINGAEDISHCPAYQDFIEYEEIK